VTRHVWSVLEKKALERQFLKFIAQNKRPGQLDCLNAQKNEPVLQKFDWRKIIIKFAVRNLITIKKRKQVVNGKNAI
jgi:hypothetical protein